MSHEWVTDQPNILSPENQNLIREATDRGYIVVEHLHFYGGCSLDVLVFHDFDTFTEHLASSAKPGDKFLIYAMADLGQRGLYALKAKYPDAQGRTPVGGAY